MRSKRPQNIPYALVLDKDYLFVGMYTFPGKIVKIRKSNMKSVGELTLQQGENDIRAIEMDSLDTEFLYANTDTSPGIVVKVNKNTMTRVAGVTLNAGENKILAGVTVDKDSVFVGTFTEPARVVQINKHTMTRVTALTLNAGMNSITAMDGDYNDLFVGLYTSPAQIVRIAKQSMTIVGTEVVLAAGQDKVTSLTHSGNMLVAGLETEPGHLVVLSGFETAVDCDIGTWSQWGTCKTAEGNDYTCTEYHAGQPVEEKDGHPVSMGFLTRTRDILTHAAHGAASCPALLKENHPCNRDVVCAMDCAGGKEWVQAGYTPDRTCENPDPVLTHTSNAMCQCPEGKPFWHSSGMCVAADVCQKQATPCEHITCQFVDGRVQINHREMEESGKGFVCQHSAGRIGGGCKCLCHEDSARHEWDTYRGAIECGKNAHGVKSCLQGGKDCIEAAAYPGQCSWERSEAQAKCEDWLDCRAIICYDSTPYCQARSHVAVTSTSNTNSSSYVLKSRVVASESLFTQAPFVDGDTIQIVTKSGLVVYENGAHNDLAVTTDAASKGKSAQFKVVVYNKTAGPSAGDINFVSENNKQCATINRDTSIFSAVHEAGEGKNTWCGKWKSGMGTDGKDTDKEAMWKVVNTGGHYFMIKSDYNSEGANMEPYDSYGNNQYCATVADGVLKASMCVNSDAQQFSFHWV